MLPLKTAKMEKIKVSIKKLKNFLGILFFYDGVVFMNNFSWSRLNNRLILLFLFLLPWQTRWIFGPGFTNGLYNEYATLSLYATEILLWIIIFLGFYNFYEQGLLTRKIFSREYVQKNPKRIFGVFLFLTLFFLTIRLSEPISLQFISRFLAGIIFLIIFFRSRVSFFSSSLVLWFSAVIQGFCGFWQFLFQKILAG